MATRQKKAQADAEPVPDDQQEAVSEPPQSKDVAELTSLLQQLMQQQADRDVRAEQDRKKQDDRWRRMQRELHQLREERMDAPSELRADELPTQTTQDRIELDQMPSGASTMRSSNWKGPKMHPYTEGEDIEHYICTFERIALACQWPFEEWALRLAPLLTGKARSAYVAMDMDDSMNYDKVKRAVLQKFEINTETFRVKFRSCEMGEEESPKELQVRLKELYNKWMEPKTKTKEQIGDTIILEQFLRILNPELRTWIKERAPKTSKEAADMAEAFLAARRPLRTQFSPKPRPPTPSGKTGSSEFRPKYTRPSYAPRADTRDKSHFACHVCGQTGHLKAHCPNVFSKNYMCSVPRSEGQREEITMGVFIDDKPCIALLDSGSDRTLVRQDSLPKDVVFCGGIVDIVCIHGDKVGYPIAEVTVKVEGQPFALSVGVLEDLPYQIVLGLDVPVLPELIAKHSIEAKTDANDCLLAVTRSKSNLKQTSTTTGWEELPFANGEMLNDIHKSQKRKKTKMQRRQDRVMGTKVAEHVLNPSEPDLSFIYSDVEKLQKEDPTLIPLFSKCVSETTKVTERGKEVFVVKEGKLYRRSEIGDQLAVPQSLRPTILNLSHSVPWAGHLGQSKTFSRMVPRFYWPQQYSDTVKYCQSCPECQLTAPSKKRDRAPLISMPIIDTPFTRIAMDIVGPLERSSAGHRYILVICDYATRYPEAFPLKKIKARQIVNCLIQLFSRVGLPKEIITDQGTNFTSSLLKQVYQLLGIRGVKTSPYHPQTDGLVERFNKTLKSMLRKFVAASGSDWDQWLPFLLFAYREVPQASTGFSPFQLLYGHSVRGPLDVLKEAWEGPTSNQGCNELSYVLKMRDKLEQFKELAYENQTQAQERQQQNYNKASRRRVFNEGQKVLLLLPTLESGLLAKWQGPYVIQRKTSPVTYELFMPDRRKKYQIFHINLLREWTDRPDQLTSFLARAVKDEEEISEQYFPLSGEAPLSPDLSHLNPDEQLELQGVMPKELFSLRPGCTHLTKHQIRLRSQDQQPIRDTTSRIPAHLVPELKKEVEEMLATGIIEPSRSEWCSPVVLVPKKDDPKLRFCINFSKLNAVSAFDPYPMPRVDELIERLGHASYLSTLDLCKGYWQVPLEETSKDLTTFRVPTGLFRFRMMPFGLHGAPATFQRLVDVVLRGAEDFAAAYMDDIVVFSRSWEEHLRHLNDVFRRIKEAGLVINAKKCHIAKPEVQYLGYVIGAGGIHPQVGKVEAIATTPLPNTKRRLRSFLGLVGWYRRLIPNFATRSALLTDMTRKSSPVKVKWTPETENAFNDLKDCLCQHPILQCPDFNLPFTVQTDASGVGLGAVLLQGEGENQLPIQFISRKLFPRETRYSTIEKEALAIKWALDTLKYYLIGKDFVLETDHRALQWIHKMKDTNARITRWYLSLQPYCFNIQYRPGQKNIIADFLSRDSEE